MASMIHIPESVSIGLQSLAFMSLHPERTFKVRTLSKLLEVSEAHLAKVFQQLVKAGILRSKRGPMGGFTLARPVEEINFLDIYKAIEKEIRYDHCPLHRSHCPFTECIFGECLHDLTRRMIDKFSSMYLSEFQKCNPEDLFNINSEDLK